MSQEASTLIRRAKMVLTFNWTGTYTQPGPPLYPHQWSWDTAFIAIGYAHYKPDRAMRALRHLFESQWMNGLLPQIVFNLEFGEYFPGPNFWHAERTGCAPRHRKTSGVVQPPLHATATLHVYRRAEGEAQAFLTEAFPHLKAWHEYLYRERDPEGEGLVYIRHPWESGMDNSPMWDSIMERLQLCPDEIPTYQRLDTLVEGNEEDRPTTAAYDRFAYLVHLGQQVPALAQAAEQEGKVAADNLVAELRGDSLTPFRYRPLGQLVDLGPEGALIDILGVRFSGFLGADQI